MSDTEKPFAVARTVSGSNARRADDIALIVALVNDARARVAAGKAGGG